jgi:hypothetical protein
VVFALGDFSFDVHVDGHHVSFYVSFDMAVLKLDQRADAESAWGQHGDYDSFAQVCDVK